MNKIYISKVVSWAPPAENPGEAPKIEFTPPLFRRRLSQLCKMVIQAVHDIIEETGCGDIKQAFISTHGDIKRQLDVSRQSLVDKEILPASFSYSVFNAPIALASLACKLKSGYSVIFPQNDDFKDAFQTAIAPVLCGDEESEILVYGNELIPEEYEGNDNATAPDGSRLNEPFVFAAVLSAEKNDICSREIDLEKCDLRSAKAFLKEIL